jgi:hypothetical protein
MPAAVVVSSSVQLRTEHFINDQPKLQLNMLTLVQGNCKVEKTVAQIDLI